MELSKASRKMILVICIAALAFIAVGTAVCLAVGSIPSIEALFFSIGVILTSALNVGKVLLLERSVKKTVEMDDPNAGKNYIRLQYLLRYFITALILVVAGLTPFISIWGALAGIFTLQISVVAIRAIKLDDD